MRAVSLGLGLLVTSEAIIGNPVEFHGRVCRSRLVDGGVGGEEKDVRD